MANYVVNKVVCTEEILNEYFIDYYPIDQNEKLEEPYISFNKLFGVKSLNEYAQKYGEYIYYGWSFSYEKNKEGLIEIKFLTRWLYPIYAIVKSIEMFKDKLIWYACEGNKIYLSKFFLDGENMQENTLYLENTEYDDWIGDNQDYIEKIEYPDDEIWHYDYKSRKDWKIWRSDNLIKRYFDQYPAKEYYNEMKSENEFMNMDELEDLKKQRKNIDENLKQDEVYYYLTVKYEDYFGDKEYNYISEDTTIKIGDKVLVDRAGNLAIAEVLETGYFDKYDSPFPVNKTKRIIKKVDYDFKIEDIEFYDEYDRMVPTNILKMEIDDTRFEFGIFNYISGKDNDDNWTTIIIKVHNKYFNYLRNEELMTSAEIERLAKKLEELLKDELKEKSEVGFYEPDLEINLYPKINLWDTGKYNYIKEGHEIQDIYMELNINLTDREGAYTGQKYVMIFDRKEIEKIVEYMKKVIKQ